MANEFNLNDEFGNADEALSNAPVITGSINIAGETVDLDDFPVFMKDWISKKANENKVDVAIITQWTKESTMEFYNTGLKDAVDNLQDFFEYVQSHVVGRISKNLGQPAELFQVFIIGQYPMKIPKKGKCSVDLLGLLNVEGKRPANGVRPFCTIRISGDVPEDPVFDVLKNIKFFTWIETYFGHSERKSEKNSKSLYYHPKTDLSYEIDTVEDNDKTKKEFSNFLGKNATITMANPVMSLPIQADGFSFIDNSDIKKIKKVTLQDFKSGTKKTGGTYGILNMTDSTFVKSEKQNTFAGWVDPEYAKKVNAGPDSIIEVWGTINKNYRTGLPEMNVCTIIPILPKPFNGKDGSIKKEEKELLSKSAPATMSLSEIAAMSIDGYED